MKYFAIRKISGAVRFPHILGVHSQKGQLLNHLYWIIWLRQVLTNHDKGDN